MPSTTSISFVRSFHLRRRTAFVTRCHLKNQHAVNVTDHLSSFRRMSSLCNFDGCVAKDRLDERSLPTVLHTQRLTCSLHKKRRTCRPVDAWLVARSIPWNMEKWSAYGRTRWCIGTEISHGNGFGRFMDRVFSDPLTARVHPITARVQINLEDAT